MISGFLRGLSTRDVEAILEEVFEEPIASKSTVSRICEDTQERYRQWCRQRLEAHDVVYLFLDAIYLKLRPDDTPSEGVLVCWGVTLEGSPSCGYRPMTWRIASWNAAVGTSTSQARHRILARMRRSRMVRRCSET